jgi:hypothetical protein
MSGIWKRCGTFGEYARTSPEQLRGDQHCQYDGGKLGQGSAMSGEQCHRSRPYGRSSRSPRSRHLRCQSIRRCWGGIGSLKAAWRIQLPETVNGRGGQQVHDGDVEKRSSRRPHVAPDAHGHSEERGDPWWPPTPPITAHILCRGPRRRGSIRRCLFENSCTSPFPRRGTRTTPDTTAD